MKRPIVEMQDDPFDAPKPVEPAVEPTLPPPGEYEAIVSRVTVNAAWQYKGNLHAAPEWIDKNWATYVDYDSINDIPKGPAVRVPTPHAPEPEKLARVGDYIVRQVTMDEATNVPREQLDVWSEHDFERTFNAHAPKFP